MSLHFYREFSALFNAKPDFLIVCHGQMIWFEVKFWTSFDRGQLQRTKNIATLCHSDLLAFLFKKQPYHVFKLGTARHIHARKDGNFIDWADVVGIAKRILPYNDKNYTNQAFEVLMKLDRQKREKALAE